jgi:hypothetical protein
MFQVKNTDLKVALQLFLHFQISLVLDQRIVMPLAPDRQQWIHPSLHGNAVQE